MMRRRLSILLVFTLAACSSQQAAKPADDEKTKAIAVEAVPVERGELVARYSATAPLEAEHAATIIAEQPGTVLHLVVEEGQAVRKGQLLAQLDADRSRLTLRQNETELQRSKNAVDRDGRLVERRLIPATTFDQTRSEYLARQADAGIARMVVRKSEIRAPFDGVITRRHIKRGQFMPANGAAFDIADFSELKARLTIPERDAGTMQVGQRVAIRVDAFPGEAFAGIVERIAPVVDRASGTIAVTVAADNASRKLRPGLFSRLDIDFDRIADATLVPKAALLAGTDPAVYVIDGGKAQRHVVRLGREAGGRVHVIEGLSPGTLVATTGLAALTDGATVEVAGRVVANAATAGNAASN